MMLAGRQQYLSSSPAEVSAAISGAGGAPLPLPDEGLIAGFRSNGRSAAELHYAQTE
jgi:hypothetical protein